jgi:hypothetical protein
MDAILVMPHLTHYMDVTPVALCIILMLIVENVKK